MLNLYGSPDLVVDYAPTGLGSLIAGIETGITTVIIAINLPQHQWLHDALTPDFLIANHTKDQLMIFVDKRHSPPKAFTHSQVKKEIRLVFLSFFLSFF